MKTIVSLLTIGLCVLLGACGDKTVSGDKAAAPNAPPTATAAADLPGKGIHDANCISCHDTGVYTRADRKVKDFDQLTGQVHRCDANLGSRLSEEDIGKVIDYLNEAFYKFPKKS